MNFSPIFRGAAAAFLCCLSMPAQSTHTAIKPETERDFDCYVQSAETRMNTRKTFLFAESDSNLQQQVVRGKRVVTVAPGGDNPHKVTGGQIYDWIGTVFIPGVKMDRLVAMLQDYDHRSTFFPDTISTSKLLCRTGNNRFRYTMRLKEPAVIDVESDVAWQRVDPKRWRLSSYSMHVQEAGKDHGYLRHLYSYWRIAEADDGVFVEGETITLSDEFGSVARAFGSALLGINPEKSLKHSLESMRDSMLKPGLQITPLPEGLPECGEAFRPAACATGK